MQMQIPWVLSVVVLLVAGCSTSAVRASQPIESAEEAN